MDLVDLQLLDLAVIPVVMVVVLLLKDLVEAVEPVELETISAILDLILTLLLMVVMVVLVFNYLLHSVILHRNMDSLDLDLLFGGSLVEAVVVDTKTTVVKVEVTLTPIMLVV